MSTILNEPRTTSPPPASQASVWPTAAKWGAVAAAIGCVYTLIAYNLGWLEIDDDGSSPNSITSTVFSILLYVGVMYVGLTTYRDVFNGGHLTTGRGVFWSLAFGIVLGLISAVFTYLFYTVLAPGLAERMLDAQLDAAVDQGVDEASLEATEAMMATFMSPGALSGIVFISSLIMPLIIGTIISLFLRRSS